MRTFFAERGVLEVETPLLGSATVPDLHIHSLVTELGEPGRPAGQVRRTLYLQTSPELAMKRLLAAGSGPIYQLGRAFRDGEAGRRHNPEFTLLEWYRPGFDHHRLMNEVEALLDATVGDRLAVRPAQRLTYAQAFERHAGIDPFRDPPERLRAAVARAGAAPSDRLPDLGDDRDAWLDLLMTTTVEPRLGWEGDPAEGRPRATFVHDYPASQAALARVRPGAGGEPGEPAVAERFELYVAGVELANGFHELADPEEQRRRFEADLAQRRARGLAEVPLDERFLAALEAGLPASAGVALGFDRLVMLATGAESIAEVMAFNVDLA